MLIDVLKRGAAGVLDRLRSRVAGRDADRGQSVAGNKELAAWFQHALTTGDSAAFEALVAGRLAANPRDATALRLSGFARLAANQPEAAAEAFRALEHAEGSGAATTTSALRVSRLDPQNEHRGQPYFRTLSDVVVDTAHWSIIRDGCIYSEDTHARNLLNNPLVQKRISADAQTVIASYPAPQRAIAQTCLFVGGDGNFSHWLFRNLLKLVSVDRAGLLYRHPWLVNADLQRYQLEYLDLLGADRAGLVKVERNQVIACRQLVVPAVLLDLDRVRQGIDWLHGRLAQVLAVPDPGSRLLYVSRGDADRRRLANDDELSAALNALGFEKVLLAGLSVTEQIRTFARARAIVAVHGAGLTNMIYAPAGTPILEITSTAIERIDLFSKLAACREQPFRTLRSSDFVDPTRAAEMHADYRVDVDAVRKAVGEVLSAAQI